MFYLRNARIWTGKEYIPKGWIKVENGIIKEIGRGEYTEGEDLNGRLIMPSFVNTHSHLYSTLFRGIGISILPLTFTDILSDLWWKWDNLMDEEAVYYSALIGGIESLRSGITTLIDHHASYGFISGSLMKIKEALIDKIGIRADLSFEISDRMGKDKAEEAIHENLEFIEYTKRNNSPLLSSHIGMHASFTMSNRTLETITKESPEYAGFHIHIAEGIEDEKLTKKRYHTSVVERLKNSEILKENTLVVHGIHLDETEKEILKNSKATLVHTPQSNMNNAVGCINISELIQKGIKISIGTDGYSINILNELRTLPLLQKHNARDFNAIEFCDIIKIWENNYKVAEESFGIKLGMIEKGYAADFLVIDYAAFTPINQENFFSHLLYGMTDTLRVEDVYVNGKKLLSNGKPTMLDYKEIQSEAQKVAEKLWKRMKEV